MTVSIIRISNIFCSDIFLPHSGHEVRRISEHYLCCSATWQEQMSLQMLGEVLFDYYIYVKNLTLTLISTRIQVDALRRYSK